MVILRVVALRVVGCIVVVINQSMSVLACQMNETQRSIKPGRASRVERRRASKAKILYREAGRRHLAAQEYCRFRVSENQVREMSNILAFATCCCKFCGGALMLPGGADTGCGGWLP